MPRPLAILIVLVVILGVVVGFVFAIVPVIDCGDRSVVGLHVTKSQEAPDVLTPMRDALVSEFGEKLVAHAKKNAEIFEQTKGEYSSWLEEGIKQASENPLAKQVVSATKKAA